MNDPLLVSLLLRVQQLQADYLAQAETRESRHMRPPRQIARPQFIFSGPTPLYQPFCELCGNDVQVGPGGVRRHLAEGGSGGLDEEMDRDHRPKPEDYHDGN